MESKYEFPLGECAILSASRLVRISKNVVASLSHLEGPSSLNSDFHQTPCFRRSHHLYHHIMSQLPLAPINDGSGVTIEEPGEIQHVITEEEVGEYKEQDRYLPVGIPNSASTLTIPYLTKE